MATKTSGKFSTDRFSAARRMRAMQRSTIRARFTFSSGRTDSSGKLVVHTLSTEFSRGEFFDSKGNLRIREVADRYAVQNNIPAGYHFHIHNFHRLVRRAAH